ncbi:MAG: NUDIX hydrolase [Oscillospiraceae bacterium]|nr:NUDIX hydrolase [Oscillospiraceae bacterium]
MTAEQEFLNSYDKSIYEKPSVAVDLLVFTIEDDRLKIVLVERDEHPFKNTLSLPGVFVGINETLDEAAARGIAEEAGLRDIYFEQLYTWGDLDRDPRMRIISVSYLSLTSSEKLDITAGSRTASVKLIDVDKLLRSDIPLAFDHRKIIEYGRERIKNKVQYSRIAFEFLPEEFTLPKLQRVYEILLGKPLYKANFRRKIAPLIEETDHMTSGDAHRPSKFYRQRTDSPDIEL